MNINNLCLVRARKRYSVILYLIIQIKFTKQHRMLCGTEPRKFSVCKIDSRNFGVREEISAR